MKTRLTSEQIQSFEQRAREMRRETIARMMDSAWMYLRRVCTRTLLRFA